jgi:hypothetical protein
MVFTEFYTCLLTRYMHIYRWHEYRDLQTLVFEIFTFVYLFYYNYFSRLLELVLAII